MLNLKLRTVRIMTRNIRFSSRGWTSTTAVGKSAILLQFTERQFRDAHDMTIGVEFGAKDVSIGDAQVCVCGRGSERDEILPVFFHVLVPCLRVFPTTVLRVKSHLLCSPDESPTKVDLEVEAQVSGRKYSAVLSHVSDFVVCCSLQCCQRQRMYFCHIPTCTCVFCSLPRRCRCGFRSAVTKVKLEIWDTAGQESFLSITR